MIKLLSFLRRRAELTPEQFRAYWLGSRAETERALKRSSPLRSAVTSLATGEVLGGRAPFFDAMSEWYFDEIGELKQVFAGPGMRAMLAQESNFADLCAETGRFVAEEYLQAQSASWSAPSADLSRPRTKVFRAVKRRADLTRGQFKDYWLNSHARLEKGRTAETTVRRITASFFTGEVLSGTEPSFDGAVSLYWDDAESARMHFAQGRQSVMRTDEANFVDLTYEVVRVVTEEYMTA